MGKTKSPFKMYAFSSSGLLLYISDNVYVFRTVLAVGRTSCPAGEQTGLVVSMDVWTRESDRGRFGYLSCQQTGRPTHVPLSDSHLQYNWYFLCSKSCRKLKSVHMLRWLVGFAELIWYKKSRDLYSFGQGPTLWEEAARYFI